MEIAELIRLCREQSEQLARLRAALGAKQDRIDELEAALQAKPSVDDIALAVVEKFGRHFQETVEHRAPGPRYAIQSVELRGASSPADDTRAACEAENRKKLDRRLNYPW